jgi:hypothetical protein
MQFVQSTRREFITLLGSAAAWPLVARAQQPVGMRRIGVLMAYAESDPEGQAFVTVFQEGLQKLGWTEGRNIPIGDQATAGDEVASVVDGGQFVPGRQRDDQIAMSARQRARRHDQAAIRGARECRDGALDLAGVAHVDRAYLHADRRRHGLDYGELANPGGYGGIPKDIISSCGLASIAGDDWPIRRAVAIGRCARKLR